MQEILRKLRFIQENWLMSLGIVVLVVTIVLFLLVLTGKLDCELTSLRDGVYKTCDCTGLEITVKSTTNSGEQKTICIGSIKNRMSFK